MEKVNRFFINSGTRVTILSKANNYRDNVAVRVTNHSEYTLTPIIMLGATSSVPTRDITSSTSLVAHESRVFTIDNIMGSNLFTEQYMFLDFVEGAEDTRTDIGAEGLEFEVVQNMGVCSFDFYDDGVTSIGMSDYI